jgi:hypothetical protein
MSQHADILKHMIAKGIANGDKPLSIVHDIEGMLEVLEYDDGMVAKTYEYAYFQAIDMRSQKAGLYGPTYSEFTDFIKNLWSYRQTLPPPA